MPLVSQGRTGYLTYLQDSPSVTAIRQSQYTFSIEQGQNPPIFSDKLA